jgi:hypothetical protein
MMKIETGAGLSQIKSEESFTLIEVMVVVVIFTLVIGASFAILNSGRIGLDAGNTRIELQQGIRKAVESIVEEVSQASQSSIIIAGAGSSISFQIPVDDLGSGSWEDISWPAEGITGSFYVQDTLSAASNNTRWGAYLWREDPSQAGSREQRRAMYILINGDIRRRVMNPAGIVIEDMVIVDNIQMLNFSFLPNGRAINMTISGQKTGVGGYPAFYSTETTFFLRSE